MKIEYNDNTYNLTFSIDRVGNLLNMNLLYLFFEVNRNIIDSKIIKDDNGFFLITHLFKDIGIKQKYLKVNMCHDSLNNIFTINTQNELDFEIPKNTEILEVDISIKYYKLSDLHYSFQVNIENKNVDENIQHFKVEKIVGKFIIKLFNNLKEYIEGNIC